MNYTYHFSIADHPVRGTLPDPAREKADFEGKKNRKRVRQKVNSILDCVEAEKQEPAVSPTVVNHPVRWVLRSALNQCQLKSPVSPTARDQLYRDENTMA